VKVVLAFFFLNEGTFRITLAALSSISFLFLVDALVRGTLE
jgi:hypothetical protein